MGNILRMADSDRARKTFYPTPASIAEALLSEVDFKTCNYVLEPSAGKGDLASAYAKVRGCGSVKDADIALSSEYGNIYEKDRIRNAQSSVDCIEFDSYLRNTLKEGGWRVIHDDFLTFETQKRYDLILMNPPFDQGDKHLLKAIELMEYGGQIACILNAETLRNPYSQRRQRLVDELTRLGAKVRYVSGAFLDAERQTDVEVALVNITIPRKVYKSTIVSEMREAPTYKTQEINNEFSEIVRYNRIDEWVNRYNFEVGCGVRMIEEFYAMEQQMLPEQGETSLLSLVVGAAGERSSKGATVNSYITAVREKYWRAIFMNKTFTNLLTSNLLNNLRADVDKFKFYEFSAYNILTLLLEMSQRMIVSVEDTIVNLFDDWTGKFHWSETTKNRHYYDGWRTNDCFRVGKKVIIPLYGYSEWDDNFQSWRVEEKFRDIEKSFDFLDSGNTDWPGSFKDAFKEAEKSGNPRNIDTKYFTVTFYKKGTAHLVFKDEKLLEKFNIFASQKKGWLPPNYGRKRYRDMSAEEQQVVDSFQGEEKYEEVMLRADYYLDAGKAQQFLLGAGIGA